MPKDFKIGMLLGLVLVIGVSLWLSTRPGLSARAGMTAIGNSEAQREIVEQNGFAPNSPGGRSAETETETESQRKETKVVEGPRYHIVLDGETLSGISFQYYDSEHKWQKILDANKNTIKDVKNLKLGMRLIIPE
ncbi:MAG: LysM peptidoglycan-binding domain-containing protein [Planctomycetota bacterium]|jgi:nucleoid-associated protein YgaU